MRCPKRVLTVAWKARRLIRLSASAAACQRSHSNGVCRAQQAATATIVLRMSIIGTNVMKRYELWARDVPGIGVSLPALAFLLLEVSAVLSKRACRVVGWN